MKVVTGADGVRRVSMDNKGLVPVSRVGRGTGFKDSVRREVGNVKTTMGKVKRYVGGKLDRAAVKVSNMFPARTIRVRNASPKQY